MLNNLFQKALRDQLRAMFFWGISLFVLAIMTMLFFPMMKDFPDLNQLLEQLPEGMMDAFTGGPVTDFASPVGYLNSQFFFLMVPLLFIVFAVGFGSGAIAGEEEKGTLEFLLAAPLPRWRILAHKIGVMVACLLLLAVVLWLGIIVCVPFVDMEIGVWSVLEAVISSVALGLAFGALAFFLGSWRGNRGLSIGVASGLAVLTYLLNSLGGLVDVLKDYRFLSPFYHNQEANPLQNGLDYHVLVLLGLALIFFAASFPLFERRDIAV